MDTNSIKLFYLNYLLKCESSNDLIKEFIRRRINCSVDDYNGFMKFNFENKITK